jgi:predicted alpha/beta-fold hydrolase
MRSHNLVNDFDDLVFVGKIKDMADVAKYYSLSEMLTFIDHIVDTLIHRKN